MTRKHTNITALCCFYMTPFLCLNSYLNHSVLYFLNSPLDIAYIDHINGSIGPPGLSGNYASDDDSLVQSLVESLICQRKMCSTGYRLEGRFII